jgi:hypothetical protein
MSPHKNLLADEIIKPFDMMAKQGPYYMSPLMSDMLTEER